MMLSKASMSMTTIMFILSMFFLYNNSFMSIYTPILSFSSFELSISFILDWSALLFSATVMLISSAIILYSFSYIPFKEQPRFSLILLIFVFSMILLIFSSNIFFIMLGWDGLGLSSYILVIFYQNFKSSESGALTILSNRVGDITLILSIGILTFLGSWDTLLSNNFPFIVIILLFIAAISKSAQMPFSAWLPAAMAAPTPISALVHSSTLVTAGVYLMIRIISNPHPTSLLLMLLVSSITMFLAGVSANWEQDLKKIIALSTLSQIAMMFFAISLFAINMAYFHLITHALFKSTMFLCAGVVIHGTNYQDMRTHGASSNNSPTLMIALGITGMALMGIPFLSGFFSKDAIIEYMMSKPLNSFVIFIALFSIGLTASYSLRMAASSTKFVTKNQPDKMFHMDKFMHNAIILMTPLSVTLGAMLLWIISPIQTFILPLSLKLSISISIFLGVSSGLLLNFKSKKFNNMGESSISLWFIHMISCSYPLKSMKMGSSIHKMDNSWTEMVSGQGFFLLLKSSSKSPDMISSFSLMMLIMFLVPPMFLISSFLWSLLTALYWS